MTSSNMSNANNEQVRRPGWIFLIPVVIIVTAITWFIVAMAGRERDLKLKHALETYVRLIRFEQGQIEVALTEHASRDFIGELSKKLELWPGQRWMIAVSSASDAKTIEETRASDRDSLVSDARADPVVAAVLAQFPGAEIVDVRVRADETDFSDGADMALPPNSDEIADEDD